MTTCAHCGRELQPAWKYCITCGTRTTVPLTGIREATAGSSPRHLNVLAVLALILGCLLSPLAAVFGHLAVAQIRRTGERGRVAAWVAVALGYLWVAVLLVLLTAYFATNA